MARVLTDSEVEEIKELLGVIINDKPNDPNIFTDYRASILKSHAYITERVLKILDVTGK